MCKRMATALVAKEYDVAAKELHGLDMSRIYKGQHKYLQYVTHAAVLFGVENATTLEKSQILHNNAGANTRRAALKQYKTLLTNTTNTVKKEANRIIAGMEYVQAKRTDTVRARKDDAAGEFVWDLLFPEGINIEELVDSELLALLSVLLPERIGKSGDALIDIASSLHASRLSSYGFLLEAELMGATRYKVNEQLDGRTCDVCKVMHGTEFEVRKNLVRQDGILNITDIEELVAQAPWPKQDARSLEKLKEMSPEDMQGAGYSTPPYHPLCRGLLTYEV